MEPRELEYREVSLLLDLMHNARATSSTEAQRQSHAPRKRTNTGRTRQYSAEIDSQSLCATQPHSSPPHARLAAPVPRARQPSIDARPGVEEVVRAGTVKAVPEEVREDQLRTPTRIGRQTHEWTPTSSMTRRNSTLWDASRSGGGLVMGVGRLDSRRASAGSVLVRLACLSEAFGAAKGVVDVRLELRVLEQVLNLRDAGAGRQLHGSNLISVPGGKANRVHRAPAQCTSRSAPESSAPAPDQTSEAQGLSALCPVPCAVCTCASHRLSVCTRLHRRTPSPECTCR